MYDNQTMNKAWMMMCSTIFGIVMLIAVAIGLLVYKFPFLGITGTFYLLGKYLYNRIRSEVV